MYISTVHTAVEHAYMHTLLGIKRLCTHANFALFVLRVLPLLKLIVEKAFAIHQKSAKTTKLFSHIAFVVFGMHN